ncbi:hypothetical protein BSPWISOXPB_4350 [uncultured Gammaproteobacteria bacterium]|nr:hypothetical protein BSPWISOXPB_4350 [uncultured Gammaproteobacteria bacterium]
MIKKEMKLMEFVSEFKTDAHYKDNFSFQALEVLYNYLLTLDEDIDFCKGAINSEWDEFEDIIDFKIKLQEILALNINNKTVKRRDNCFIV